ncbi:cytochrome c biogenesis CcdA family protein [Halorientalis brevis]|uniref:Cytochrome c biogenesis CcdA family protein n=1 Tax=Halorientalis brevis TaxID=1126241 RepID=A0ABD6C6Y7_9EURY|nr:cytochrome c biogenesis protein CcdA [Halorientalis brevis]
MVDLPSATAVFLAGILTILTPCCLPMLPPLLAGGVGHRLRPVGIVAGSVVSFTAAGVATGALGSLDPDAFRLPFTVLMIGFGAVMVDDDLNAIYERYASRVAGRATSLSTTLERGSHPLASAVALGLLLGVIWLPCVGPVLGAVLAYVGTTGDLVRSGALLFVYGTGFGLPLLVVAYGGKRSGQWLRDRVLTEDRPAVLRRVAGGLLVLTGVSMLFEIDKLAMTVANGVV